MSKLVDILHKWGKKQVFYDNGGTITVRSKEWVEKGSLEYESVFKRPQTDSIRTNIPVKKMYSMTSQAKDWFLELQLRSDKYKFNNMLAVVDPFGVAPLTAIVLFTTMMDYRVRATVVGEAENTSFVTEYPAEKRHRIPILGLYPGRSTQVVIELLDENGQPCDTRSFPLTTEPLPEDLQDVVRAKRTGQNPSFSNILISGGLNIRPCVFDREGKIRYYLEAEPNGYGIFPLSKGRFLFMERDICTPSYANPHSVQMYDMDYLGRIGRTYLVKNGAHHAVYEKSVEGNLFVSGNSFEGHSEDVILEIDRQSGETVHKVKIGDLFDDKYQDMTNWAHINSVAYQEEEQSVLVSMRNVHSVALLDWETDELRWLLADPRFWEGTAMEEKVLRPVGDVPWFYQQNAVVQLELGEDAKPDTRYIMVFDNHWHKRRKVRYFDKDKKSYVSIYEIDEKERTVQLYKRFPCAKSKIRSNAVLDREGRRLYAMAGCLVQEIKDYAGMICEYDFDTMEVLSEYYVKPGFFRAYEFCPDMMSLSRALAKNNNYIIGELKQPICMQDEEAERIDFQEAQPATDSDVEYEMQEDILYIRERDHAVSRVYFRGRESVWFVDFSETDQTMETFEEVRYSIAMWLESLPADSYALYIQLGGELQDTQKKITKQI